LRGGGLLSIEKAKNRLERDKNSLDNAKDIYYIIEKNKIDTKSNVKTQKG